jgi:hypothetical protein
MFSYSSVENALASNLGLDDEDRPAFAAKLRHLRNLGIPHTKPGTGRRLSYSTKDVEQMLFALLLESLGCSPRWSVDIVHSLMEQAKGKPLPNIVAVLPDSRLFPITAERLLMLVRNQPTMAVLNLSLACANLERSLRDMGKF